MLPSLRQTARFALAALLALTLQAGCAKSTFSSKSRGKSGTVATTAPKSQTNPSQANQAPSATWTNQPASPTSGDVMLGFNIIDAESDAATVVIEFSIDGGLRFQNATAASSLPLTALATSPKGESHLFLWDSGADIPGRSTGVLLRSTPADTRPGSPALSQAFDVDNITPTPTPSPAPAPTPTPTPAPANRPPTAAFRPFTTPVIGQVDILYDLFDADSDPCSVVFEFSSDGGLTWARATSYATNPSLTRLAASPRGNLHMYLWDSAVDIPIQTNTAVLRVTPHDGRQAGPPAQTRGFSVRNAFVGPLPPTPPQPPTPPTPPTPPAPPAPPTPITNASVARMVPNQGDVAGNTLVRIEGAGFHAATVIRIDGRALLQQTLISPTVITGLTPTASAPGAVNVEAITNGPAGVLVATTAGAFTYTQAAPANLPPSASIQPIASPAALTIAIDYQLFDAESDPCSVQVLYSTNGSTWKTATSSGVNAMQNLAASPSGNLHQFLWDSASDLGATNQGLVLVRVIPRDAQTGQPGSSTPFQVNNAATTATLAVTRISPSSGPSSGGTQIQIQGTGFVLQQSTVTLANNPLQNVVVWSSTLITGTTLGVAWTGPGDIVVSAGGQSARLSNAFSYTSPQPALRINSVTPNSGPIAGGTTVTIQGAGFHSGDTDFEIAGIPMVNVRVISSSQATAATPTVTTAQVGTQILRAVNRQSSGSYILVSAFSYTLNGTNPQAPPAPVPGAPVITGVSFVGQDFQIHGSGFSSNPNDNKVIVNGTTRPAGTSYPDLIHSWIPNYVTSGTVVVTVKGVTSNSFSFQR